MGSMVCLAPLSAPFTFAQVGKWSGAELDRIATDLTSARDRLVQVYDDHSATVASPDRWMGTAADGAAHKASCHAAELADSIAAVAALRQNVLRAAERVHVLVRRATEVEWTVASARCRVTEVNTIETLTDEMLSIDTHRALQQQVDGVLQLAMDIDAELYHVFQKVIRDKIDVGRVVDGEDAAEQGRNQGMLHQADNDGFAVEVTESIAVTPSMAIAVAEDIFLPGALVGLVTMSPTVGLGFAGAGLADLWAIKESAETDSAKETEGMNARADHAQNAVQHTLWNARMAERFGDGFAEDFATGYERKPEGNIWQAEAMDLYNNEIGRQIAERADSSADLTDLVMQEYLSGNLLVLDEHKYPVFSEQTICREQ